MQYITSLLFTACALFFAAVPQTVIAQSACADHATMSARLATQYGEDRHALGLASNNTMLEIYASSESGNWTILITNPGGLTCLVAAGSNFQTIPVLAMIEDQDT